jgi:hypothetical protein
MYEDLGIRLEKWFDWQEGEEKHNRSFKLSFSLTSDLDSFAKWVTDRVWRMSSLEYPEFEWSGITPERFKTEMYTVQLPTYRGQWTTSHLAIVQSGVGPDPIDFAIVPIDPARIEVTAVCRISLVRPYFVELLLEIDGTWHGAVAEALDHLGDFDEEALAEAMEQESADEPPPRSEIDDPTGGLYGTCRDMTIGEVRNIVKRCKEFKERGGNIPEFYRREDITPGGPKSYELETLRSWLKNPKFRPKDT